MATGPHEVRLHVLAPDTIYGLIEFDVIHHITITQGGHGRGDDDDCGKR
jgi:hypothetical protein